MAEQRELVIGKTVIGQKEEPLGSGQYFTVHFGNYLTPHKGGTFQHLDYDEYMGMLSAFLKSKEGQKYKAPTEADNANAIQLVIDRERAASAKYREEKREVKVQAPEKAPVYITEDIPKEFRNSSEMEEKEDAFEDDESAQKSKRPMKKERQKLDELTLMYKRQANILTIAVIFLTLVVALQMLLNLYLLTR